jgi:hypothetical protein
MSKRKSGLLVISVVAVLLSVLVLSGCSSAATVSGQENTPSGVNSSSAKPSGAVQSSSGGSVTVKAKLLGHEGDSLVFEITMDTHSVDLDKYDLGELAVMRDDQGGQYNPIAWQAPAGGHHRSGKLAFLHPDLTAKTFELVIRNVAGIEERALRWQV